MTRPFEALGWTLQGQGAYSTFRRHHLITPDGGWLGRDRLHHPGAVAVLPVLGEDVVLVRQWREAAGEALLEVPAGLVEPGEALEEAAARECLEETGYRPSRLESLGRWSTSPGISDETVTGFVADELEAVVRRPDGVEEADAEVVTMAAADAVAAALDGRIRDLKSVALILDAGLRRGWHTRQS